MTNYPKLTIEVNDVENIIYYSSYDGLFFSEITWYILENKLIDRIFSSAASHLKGKYFRHNLVFYRDQ